MVTCSGVSAEGSLRVVRNGIGLAEAAAVELSGVRGLWALRAHAMDAFDTFLVLTFVGETRLLALNAEDELDEAELAAFDANAQVEILPKPPLPYYQHPDMPCLLLTCKNTFMTVMDLGCRPCTVATWWAISSSR